MKNQDRITTNQRNYSWGLALGGLALGLLLCSSSQADVLLIDGIADAHGRDLPRTGLLMAQVQAQWGEPIDTYPAVGSPPITRWDFPEFSVYFEYDHVISSVLQEGEVLKTRDKN